MIQAIVMHSQVRSWLHRSVLAPHVSSYITYLRRQRYTERTQHGYTYGVAHFAHWLSARQISLSSLDEEAVRAFLEDHLPACDCPYPARRGVHENRTALRHLLTALRANGAIGQRPASHDPTDSELALFEHYMDHVCGLAANTRRQRMCILRRLFTTHDGFKPGGILSTAHIRGFVLNGQKSRNAGTVRVLGGALRCYLRFRALEGDDVQGLLDAVPSAAHWRLAALPEVFTEEEIRRLLSSFERLTCSPKRGYAMARCLTDLGLRASEVVGLQLEDINWREGTICLATGKLRRASVLPLPAEAGRAIADYLQTERPSTSNRAVFVRHVAPFDKPIGPGVVRRAIREAYQRCGWTHSRVHILRHSIASTLLRHGTPLKEIADLLRHRSLDTSMIYTKVDLRRLAAVAMSWPGRQL
jgi:site-specific recombinase XerD